MSLISCPECGKQVSSAARACPNCAHPIATAPSGGAIDPDTGMRTNTTVTVSNPQQDRFLTRNRGCLEVVFWLLVALVAVAVLRQLF